MNDLQLLLSHANPSDIEASRDALNQAAANGHTEIVD